MPDRAILVRQAKQVEPAEQARVFEDISRLEKLYADSEVSMD